MYIKLTNGIAIPASKKYKDTLKQYEIIMAYLKNNGALLSAVKPEFLLSEVDFNYFLNDKIEEIVISNLLNFSDRITV